MMNIMAKRDKASSSVAQQVLNATRQRKNEDGIEQKCLEPIIMASIDSYHPVSGLKNKLLSY